MDTETQTVWDRMMAMGLSEDRARSHLAEGRVQVDGQVITDPDHPAAPPARVVFSQL